METMFQYIEETPGQFRTNIHNSENLTRPLTDVFVKKNYKRIEIIASGSSYNGAMTARFFMEKVLAMKVEVISSFTFSHFETIFDPDTFYIGIGQSGRSTNTNEALSLVRSHGCFAAGVTGNVDSVMKDHCDIICSWEPGIEKIGYVTKGYSTLVLFLMLFSVETAKAINKITENEADQYKKQLLDLTDAMEKAIPDTYAWYKRNAAVLTKLQRIQVLGYGPGYGAAIEGALKIEETFAKAASGYELEEFMHGPCYELNEDCAVIVLDTSGAPSQRAIALYKEIHTLTPHCFLITGQALSDEKVLTVHHDLDEYMSALIVITALQTIAAHAHKEWVNPNLSKRIAFCEAMNVKAAKTGRETGL